jgi:hypothetical protein
MEQFRRLSWCLLLLSALSGCAPTEPELFGTGTTIPADVKVSDVIARNSAAWGVQNDSEFVLIGKLWDQSSSLKNAEIDNLQLPTFENAQLLKRHLTTSCKWRVSDEGDKVVAFRRYVDEAGNWTTGFNSYWDEQMPKKNKQWVQCRTSIGLEKSPFSIFTKAQEFESKPGKVELKLERFQGYTSTFRDRFGSSYVEIFEQSPHMDRRFTQQELKLVKSELDGLSESATARRNGFDPNLMPEFSVRHGSPQLKVREANMAEHFNVDAFINPGEEGECYLKVFEASKNLRLTESRIKRDSLEYVGWSGDPNEEFFFNCLIPIYEVDAAKDFAARFEIWFVPKDKTKPERKLYEDIYKLPTQHWPR